MNCPVCGEKTKTIETRHPDPEVVRRRRECLACGYRFSTVEYEEAFADAERK